MQILITERLARHFNTLVLNYTESEINILYKSIITNQLGFTRSYLRQLSERNYFYEHLPEFIVLPLNK